MKIQRVFSEAPWESMAGYCRAIRVGERILMGGTVAFNTDGSPYEPGDAYKQTLHCLNIIERSIRQLGVDRRSIIGIRIYTTSMKFWPQIAQAHKEFFEGHPPTLMCIGGAELIAREYVVELTTEATACEIES
ncbi:MULTISPECIES: Rid family hydrolase [unclassified Pseudomonas]|uniref:Rid family hydrolase n=1 Tax=unclassified Pseudomonas TaxID=196821 RepID=UPI000A1F836C|nr:MULTISPECIES: Rid family hydrolase [unclassified Pseudomonas]